MTIDKYSMYMIKKKKLKAVSPFKSPSLPVMNSILVSYSSSGVFTVFNNVVSVSEVLLRNENQLYWSPDFIP